MNCGFQKKVCASKAPTSFSRGPLAAIFTDFTMTDLTIYKEEFCISTDKRKLDIDAIHEFLSTKAYWCLNIPKDKVQTANENSLCFGIYQDNKQIGFARIMTQRITSTMSKTK